MSLIPLVLPAIALPILAAVFGLIVGSFLNVVIHRWPLGESVLKPLRSYCPHCKETIAWYDNIPFLSYLLLKGKCRHCGGAIAFRYFAVELLSCLLSLATWFYFQRVAHYLIYYVLLVAPLIAIIFIDLKHRLIPNVLTLPGIAVGVIVHYWDAPPLWETKALIESLIGIAVGGGFLFIVAWTYEKIKKREGLGMGDVKLAMMFGAFFGWQQVLMILLFGSVMGSLVGLLVVAVKRDWLYQLPFGPFLAIAAYLQLFFGEPILEWYLSLMH